MKKTTLAVPAGSARVDAFLAEARVSGRSTAVLSMEGPGFRPVPQGSGVAEGSGSAETPDDAEVPGEDMDGNAAARIPWNPLSFASARAAIIEAETALGGSIDELALFADPPGDRDGIVDLSPKAIESAALAWAAGWAELIREAAKRFGERGGGSIVLVVVQSERGPLGAMAAGALAGLAEGMISVGSGLVRFIAVGDESDQPDLLARYVIKSLDEASRSTGRPAGRDAGRMQRFGGRSNLFGRG